MKLQTFIGLLLLLAGLAMHGADHYYLRAESHMGLLVGAIGLLLLPLDFSRIREAYDRWKNK